MEKPRPQFEDSRRITEGAKERGSEMVELERRLYDLRMDERDARIDIEMSEHDRDLIDSAQESVYRYIADNYPNVVLDEDIVAVVADQGWSHHDFGINVARYEEGPYGDARLFLNAVHETLHSQSYASRTIGKKVSVTRVGLELMTELADGTRGKFFQGINEALTMSHEQRIFDTLPEDNRHKRANRERLEAASNTTDGFFRKVIDRALASGDVGVTALEAKDEETESETGLMVGASYYTDTKLLKSMLEYADYRSPSDGASKMLEALDVAYFAGDMTDMKKLIRTLYGSRGFAIVARSAVMDAYPIETTKSLMEFIAGFDVDVEQLLLDLAVRECVQCEAMFGGATCTSCGNAFEVEKETPESREESCNVCTSVFVANEAGNCVVCNSPR